MARRENLADRLDEAVEAMVADPSAPRPEGDPRLRALLEIAAELVLLPAPDFKERLLTDLRRSASFSLRVEPYLQVRGAAELIAFARRAFGAEELSRDTHADGTVAHAEIKIGDSVLGTGDAGGGAGESRPTAIHLYVPDADAVYARAVEAGATSLHAVTDQPYGDREGGVRDPFGNHWYIGTHRAGQGRADAPHVPAGLRSANSYLHPRGAAALIDFLERAFGAEEAFRHADADGSVAHAKVRFGESVVEMGEAHGPYQPMPTVYHLYVDDTDAAYRRALAAGAASLSEPADRPWGYRNAGVRDPAGNQWWLNAPIAARPAATARSVTPFFIVRDVRRSTDFLRDAFGAELVLFERGGDPPHDHAEMRLGETLMMMGEAMPGVDLTTSAFYLHVADVDAAYERALAAGAVSREAPNRKPWGHRMAHVVDPIGNAWFIAAPASAED